jgi:pimeloyl-ACP methyl ester carboxylesterase
VLVHGTMTWGEECFSEQRPLAAEFALDVMDRRGFGDSPDIACSDWEVDAEDVVGLLGSAGAHLVGHSYGGVVALAAAAHRPAAVRSLVLIEPSALRIAEQVPVVKAALERNRAMFADGAPFRGMSAQDYLRAGAELGFPVPEFIERRLAACHTNCDGRAAVLGGADRLEATRAGVVPQGRGHGQVGSGSPGIPGIHRRRAGCVRLVCR